MAKKTLKTKKTKVAAKYWLRRQDTGDVREITLDEWHEKGDTLRLEGNILVDAKGNPIDDKDVPSA